MPDRYAEVIFETGSKSVLSYDDESEVLNFVANHTDRAKSGQPGTAQDYEHRNDIEPELAAQADSVASRPAERITKVLLYDKHPLEYNPDGNLTPEEINGLVTALEVGGGVNVQDLINALRGEINAVISGDIGPHDSYYKMNHVSELDINSITGTGAGA